LSSATIQIYGSSGDGNEQAAGWTEDQVDGGFVQAGLVRFRCPVGRFVHNGAYKIDCQVYSSQNWPNSYLQL